MRPLKLIMTCFGPFLSETVDFTALGDHLFLISGITVKSFCVYEVFILDIVLDNFLIDFVCIFLFLSVLFR